jgi:hypothetical protein
MARNPNLEEFIRWQILAKIRIGWQLENGNRWQYPGNGVDDRDEWFDNFLLALICFLGLNLRLS